VPGQFGPGVTRGHVQREGAARVWRALDADLAAQQLRDLAADREAESRAAELAARGSVGLLERLEDQLLLVPGNADAGVGDLECHHFLRVVERPRGEATGLLRPLHRERDAALLRELERVRQQ